MSFIDDFAHRANAYLASRDAQPVYPRRDAIDALHEFDTPLQEHPVDPTEVLALLDHLGSPATVKSTGGRYHGFVIGGSLPAAMSAKLLASVWDQNSALTVMSPVAAQLEKVAGKWLLDIFGLPRGTGFGFVTGDTMANFCGLAAARHQLLKRAGWDVEANGMFHAPEINVIVGEEVHASVLKALSMVGFGRDRVLKVPVDAQGRMLADRIPVTDRPAIICTQAGNVNTGSFDPVGEICERYRNEQTWVHVDGAFGLWAAACPEKIPRGWN